MRGEWREKGESEIMRDDGKIKHGKKENMKVQASEKESDGDRRKVKEKEGK